MNRIRRIRRTFTRLVIVTAISFVIFLVWSGVSERDEQFIDSTRGVSKIMCVHEENLSDL